MKKLLSFGFGLAFAASMLTGLGCAITNYELITDNDIGGAAVNTSGNTYIRATQVATIWPDGNDNLTWYVDQKANGDRKLSTTNYFTTGAASPFHDDLYCSPDWSGCKVATADDPEVGDVDIFDYAANPSCAGYRSLSLLVSTTRYYGECGRAQTADRTTRLVSLGNEMSPVQYAGATWLHTNLSALNSSLRVNNNNGSAAALPITSQIGVTANFAKRQVVLDMTNPNNRTLAQNFINWSQAHPGPSIDATITISGNDFVYHLKTMNNASSWPQLHY